jgi:hypothetical protein
VSPVVSVKQVLQVILKDVLVLPFIDPHDVGKVDRIAPRGGEQGVEELQGRDNAELGNNDQKLVDGSGVTVRQPRARSGLRKEDGERVEGREKAVGEGWEEKGI